MEKTRLETFSDGVIAIIITIMVLELKAPHETTLSDWLEIAPKIISYVFSFFIIAVMWINNHHVFQTVKTVDGRLIWANINLLFWMSLIPFATAYIGEVHTDPFAVALYGAVLSVCVIAFTYLRFVISKRQLDDAELTAQNKRALRKSVASNCLYVLSVPLASVSVYLSFFIFVLIPVLYFIPQKELEKQARLKGKGKMEYGKY